MLLVMKTSRSWVQVAFPLSVLVLMGLLTLFGVTRQLELQILDVYTRLVPPPKELPEIVIVDIDDPAIQRVGTWPWSRDLHANYLADLKSLGADTLSFDVEFVDRGPVGVNSRERDDVLVAKGEELAGVFEALKDRQLLLDEAYDASKTLLSEGVLLTARDNDTYLGNAIKIFGRAFTTLNYNQTNDNADALEAYAFLKDKLTIGPVTGDVSRVKTVTTLRGAIVSIATNAAGAGMTNVDKDIDGTLRRIDLLFRLPGENGEADRFFGQLAFTPLWVRLGKPAIEVAADKITLKTSALAQNARPDVVIPLDPDGQMVINWPHEKYGDSFIHVGVSELQNLGAAQISLAEQVAAMQKAGYMAADLDGAWNQARIDRTAAIANGDPEAYAVAEAESATWRQAVLDLVDGPLERQLRQVLEFQAKDPKVPQASKDKIPGVLENVAQTFTALRAKAKAYFDLRADLEKRLKGSLTFYGWTSIATTDVAVNPFDPAYYAVGTHAAIANTILTAAWMNEWPGWASFLLGALLSVLVAIVMNRIGTLAGVLVGFSIFLGLLAAAGLYYALSGTYPGVFVPGVTVFLTVLGLTLVKFWGTEAEKRYIRGAFSTYLSPEVIKQLEADPDKLKLGGEKKVLTAVFTDVKGFSTVSEKMDPNDLVTLLNHYLTGMSDQILDTQGTIDKFEGDAIIAFWGAPLAFDDHAQKAVKAALQMKKVEAGMNERFLAEGLSHVPLLTRIGINTGEMTVGNMGTARRMDYTMMGNAVNLAARLEGVNKQYGTWILTSQSTRDRLDDSVVVRKLDRVRVVGISTPVRLFDVVAFRTDADQATLEKIVKFELGIDAYETQEFDKARGLFLEVLALDPKDGPAQTFLQRAEAYLAEPPAKDWDGVFSLTSK